MYKYSHGTDFYRKDAQGNIIALLDSNGNVVVRYVYDAWGNHAVLDANGADITDVNHIGVLNPFRYRGYFYDEETGLYYLKTRYYDPETGRFITIDDISYLDPETINGLNLYAYCGNNPVMNVDPTGTWDWEAFWNLIAGIAIVVTVAVISVATAGLAAAAFGVAGTAMASAMMAGAAVGSLALGAASIGSQLIVNGYGNINLGTVAIDSIVGGVTGMLTGASFATSDALLIVGLRIAKVGVRAIGTLFHGFNERIPQNEVFKNAKNSIITGLLIEGFGFGAQMAYVGQTLFDGARILKMIGASILSQAFSTISELINKRFS